MNKSDVTKAMLAGLVKTFNEKILSPDDPIMYDTKKTHTIKAMTEEIIKTANEDLLPEDKDKFSADEIELMRVLDIDVANLFGVPCVCEPEKIDESVVEEAPVVEKAAKKKGGKAKAKVEPVVETKPVEPEPEKKVAETKKPKKEKGKEDTKAETKKNDVEKEVTKKPDKQNGKKPIGVGKFIAEGVKSGKFKSMTNQQIADLVRKNFQGAVTTHLHVATYKYRIEKGKI
ncbi:hypothetical protein A2619_02350 [candidate division WWE3 bacterium RIFOXYD1_FULL_39_9]|uniref:Uncharacterized protein n=1 Tax=candidate division WWE3 bacterium RIFOXYD1_FULL_39_9 TaxID=1802649 RepID=A0A1F4X3J0_UNCKA|nr:MAG: hypothetical protein A2619_02350 [candidate division WWE3 bacterium RIFOXYD1_FULL_39_9]